MSDKIAVARVWTSGLSKPDAKHRTAVAEVVADDVERVDTRGTVRGKEQIVAEFGRSTLAAAFARGTWSEPTVDGDVVTSKCTFPPGSPVPGVVVRVTVDDAGRITRAQTELVQQATMQTPPEDELAAHLQSRYGIRVERLTRPEGHNPFVHRVHRLDGPDWITRCFGPARAATGRVDGEVEILRYLERHDYPAERLAHDEPLSTFGTWTVLATTFAGENAQETPELKPVFEAPAALGARAELLGRLQALPPEPGAVMRDGGSWHPNSEYEGLPGRDIAYAHAMLDSIESVVPAKARKGFDTLRAVVNELDDCADLPRCLVHPDFMWKNVVVGEQGEFTIVDWTSSGRGPRVISFGNFLNAAQSGGKADPERVEAIVTGYSKHVRLEPGEFDRLHLAMRIGAVYFGVMSYRGLVRAGRAPSTYPIRFTTSDAIARLARKALARGA